MHRQSGESGDEHPAADLRRVGDGRQAGLRGLPAPQERQERQPNARRCRPQRPPPGSSFCIAETDLYKVHLRFFSNFFSFTEFCGVLAANFYRGFREVETNK